MMTIVEGDLVDFAIKRKFDAIAHGCNCMHIMGAGIAKVIRENFPEAYEADLKTTKGDIRKMGNYSSAHIYDFSLDVINAYTQFRPGYGVNYTAIRKVFERINESYKGKKVGIPKIGSGIAGGDWGIISRIIEDSTPDLNIVIVDYKRIV